MAERHARQDERVFRSTRPIADNLDLTVYRDGSAGWCLTTREPLHDRSLAEGAVAIATIAQQTGFSDQSALSRQFRQVTGLAPQEYRALV